MSAISEMAKDEALVADSYGRVKAELAALPLDQLVPLNVDVQFATRTILGALPEMRVLRAQIVKDLPSFDVAPFDKLEDYAQALTFAHSSFQIATQPPDDMDIVIETGTLLRERMLADTKALGLYGLFDVKQLEHLKGGNGFNNLAADLELLSRAMTAAWETIKAKALTPFEDVQAASRIALRLTRIIGLREQGPARLAAAAELRLRAFTVVIRTYEEAREAIGYLRRREGDADNIAPTLYPGKARRKATAEVEANTQGPNGTLVIPPAPATPATGASPAAAPTAPGAAGPTVREPFMA